MNDDDAKKAILARRARFIAAAMVGAGISVSCSNKDSPPQVCLSVAIDQDAGPPPGPSVCLSPIPSPCLSVAPPQPEAPDAGATIRDAGAPPRPCLSQRPPSKPPKPQPCLSPPPPKVCLDMPPG
jgi:hypothetical protein